MNQFNENTAFDYRFYTGKLYGVACIFFALFVFYYRGFIFVGDAAAYGKPASNFGVPGPGFFHFFFSGDFLIEGVGRGLALFLLSMASVSMLFSIVVLQRLVFHITFFILGLLFIPMLLKIELIRLWLYLFLFLWFPLKLTVISDFNQS